MGTKYLKKDETILYKEKIKTQKKIKKEEISPLLLETPNSRLLLLPIAHLVYLRKLGESFYDSTKITEAKNAMHEKYDRKIVNAASNRKKQRLNSKKLNKTTKLDRKLKEGNQLMRWGEELSIYHEDEIRPTELNIESYLFSKGYFDGEVDPKITKKKQKTTVEYVVIPNASYTIDSIVSYIENPRVDSIYLRSANKSYIRKKQFDQDNFSRERERIYDDLSDHGYYNFKRQYVQFEVDSTSLEENKLIVRKTIGNPIDGSSHKQFTLDSIIFNTQSKSGTKSEKRNFVQDGKTFNFSGDNRYPQRVLNWRIFLEKDSLYSKTNTLETQKQLSYLDIFKFVNINYDSSGGKFIANIFTSPLQKYETSTEAGLSVLDQQQAIPGPFFNFNAKSRNVFGKLDIIQLSANTSIQGITSVSDDENIYSRFQYGGELSITFPLFIFPFREKARDYIGKFNPRTRFATNINFEDRRDEYERNIFSGSMSYIWQVKNKSLYTIVPFELEYINSRKTAGFEQNLIEQGNQSLISAFESSLNGISSFKARFNNNNYGIGKNTSSLIETYLRFGGNYLSVLGDNPLGINLENLQTFNYSKVGVDLRRVNSLTSKSSVAYRLNIGVAMNLNDKKALPYDEYFFAGGSNSIRAWQPRRLGPGSFAIYDSDPSSTDIIINNELEQPGDILIESSIEYRHDLFGFIDYALFIDAGNSWLWRSETIAPDNDGFGDGTNDDGKFRLNTFASEIAVGAGYGFRFDFSFLVLRVDFAYKLVNPAFPLGQRFVLDTYEWNDLWDFNEKGAINIGIGYPF